MHGLGWNTAQTSLTFTYISLWPLMEEDGCKYKAKPDLSFEGI